MVGHITFVNFSHNLFKDVKRIKCYIILSKNLDKVLSMKFRLAKINFLKSYPTSVYKQYMPTNRKKKNSYVYTLT